MEHPCYKCGASVEEGTPFCPQCQAPQIRVIGPEIPETSPAGVPQAFSAPYAGPGAHALQSPAAWQAAGLAALWTLPLILLIGPGLAMLVAGFLSVVLYRRRTLMVRITAGLGARLGTLCGLLASGIFVASVAVAVAVFHQGDRIQQGVLEAVQKSADLTSTPPPPELVEFLKTPSGLMFVVLMWVLVTLALAAAGGALGAALLGRKNHL